MKKTNNNLELGRNWKMVTKGETDILVYSTKSVKPEEIRENGTVLYEITSRTGENNEIIVKEFLEIDCKFQEIPGFTKSKAIEVFQSNIKEKTTDFANKLRTSVKTIQDLTEIAESVGQKFKVTTSVKGGSIFQTKEAMEKFLKFGYEEEKVRKIMEVIFNG